MSWVILALLAAASSGAATVSNKYVFKRVSPEPMVQIVSGGVVGVILSMIVTLVHGYHAMTFHHAVIGIIAGLFFGLALTSIIYAVRLGDVSQIGPLRLLPPVFVAVLAAIFLHESLTPAAYAGMVLVMAGVALLDTQKTIKIKLNSVLGLMIVSGLMFAVVQVLTKYLLRYYDPYTILLYVRVGLLVFILPLFYMYRRAIKAAIVSNPLRAPLMLFLSGFLGTSGIFLLMFASEKGPVTAVSTIAATSPFFMLFYLAVLARRLPDVYAEASRKTNVPRRALLAVVIFIGVALIVNAT